MQECLISLKLWTWKSHRWQYSIKWYKVICMFYIYMLSNVEHVNLFCGVNGFWYLHCPFWYLQAKRGELSYICPAGRSGLAARSYANHKHRFSTQKCAGKRKLECGRKTDKQTDVGLIALRPSFLLTVVVHGHSDTVRLWFSSSTMNETWMAHTPAHAGVTREVTVSRIFTAPPPPFPGISVPANTFP